MLAPDVILTRVKRVCDDMVQETEKGSEIYVEIYYATLLLREYERVRGGVKPSRRDFGTSRHDMASHYRRAVTGRRVARGMVLVACFTTKSLNHSGT